MVRRWKNASEPADGGDQADDETDQGHEEVVTNPTAEESNPEGAHQRPGGRGRQFNAVFWRNVRVRGFIVLRFGTYHVDHREDNHPDRIDEMPVPGDHNDMLVVIVFDASG